MTAVFACVFLSSCQSDETGKDTSYKKTGELKLSYAKEFSADYYEGGFVHLHVNDGTDYVLIPDGGDETDLGIPGAVIIKRPLQDIYLAASSAMDFFVQLDSLSDIKSVSTTASDYSIEEAKRAIEDSTINYVGKYSAPDYEAILSTDCNLAIESTMITHSPDIKEALERLSIPVVVERSSYEESPMGRLEWIKFYGVLLGKEKEAEDFFSGEDKKMLQMEKTISESGSIEAPTVAFFYVSANGYVNVRKPGDYISTMIEMAGGRYCLSDLDIKNDNKLSTMNLDWEEFYKYAADADIIIYNGTIDGGIRSAKDLADKNALFNDFKAVGSGKVYCTNTDMFQKSSSIVEVLLDLYRVINEKDLDELTFIERLRP